jgi:hypothetical protein
MGVSRTVAVAGLTVALGMAALAGRAEAGTGFAVKTFSFGPAEDSFAAFDPSLGTLKSVSFQLSGEFQPLILSDTALPTTEPLTVEQSFTGFAGKGFTSITPSTVFGQVITTTLGAPAVPIAPFVDSFTFNALSDITGFTADSYGGLLGAHLADFLAGGPTGGEIIELPALSASAIGFGGALLPAITTTAVGGGIVTYAYTTPDHSPPPGIPEPAAWTLLLTGFALTGAAVRRRDLAYARSDCSSGWSGELAFRKRSRWRIRATTRPSSSQVVASHHRYSVLGLSPTPSATPSTQ